MKKNFIFLFIGFFLGIFISFIYFHSFSNLISHNNITNINRNLTSLDSPKCTPADEVKDPYKPYVPYADYKPYTAYTEGPDFCKTVANPLDLADCRGTEKYCMLKNDSSYCQGTLAYCAHDPRSIHCVKTRAFCTDDPTNNDCRKTEAWCNKMANDEINCKGTASYCSRMPSACGGTTSDPRPTAAYCETYRTSNPCDQYPYKCIYTKNEECHDIYCKFHPIEAGCWHWPHH